MYIKITYTALGTTIYVIFNNNIVWIRIDFLAFESRFQILVIFVNVFQSLFGSY